MKKGNGSLGSSQYPNAVVLEQYFAYPKEANAANNGRVLGRGQHVIGRGHVALGLPAGAGALDDDTLGRHCDYVRELTWVGAYSVSEVAGRVLSRSANVDFLLAVAYDGIAGCVKIQVSGYDALQLDKRGRAKVT